MESEIQDKAEVGRVGKLSEIYFMELAWHFSFLNYTFETVFNTAEKTVRQG